MLGLSPKEHHSLFLWKVWMSLWWAFLVFPIRVLRAVFVGSLYEAFYCFSKHYTDPSAQRRDAHCEDRSYWKLFVKQQVVCEACYRLILSFTLLHIPLVSLVIIYFYEQVNTDQRFFAPFVRFGTFIVSVAKKERWGIYISEFFFFFFSLRLLFALKHIYFKNKSQMVLTVFFIML